jgi:hypothetical protein
MSPADFDNARGIDDFPFEVLPPVAFVDSQKFGQKPPAQV